MRWLDGLRAPALRGLRALAWLAVLCWAAAAQAQGEVGHRGVFWTVDRPAEPAIPPSHLFGTVHVDDPRVLALRPAVAQALRAARLVMLELQLDEDSGRRFLAASQLAPPATLRALLGAEGFAQVAQVLAARYDIDAAQAERFKPWAAYLTLSQPAGARGETLDERLGRLAREQGTPVRGLETLDEQIASMEAIPLASQLTLLDRSARDHDAVQAAIAPLLQRYLDQDLDGLAQIESSVGGPGSQDDAALRRALDDQAEHLVRRRNQRMLERLLPPLREGGVFAAMGALHLQGEQGLLALLQQAGWRVRRGD